MIPSFNEEGNLPPGIYTVKLEEFKGRFVYNIKRKELYDKLMVFINAIKRVGCKAVYVDGSFVTKKILPKDIDICWENLGVEMATALSLMPVLKSTQMLKLVYGTDIFPAQSFETRSGKLFIDFFRIDRTTGKEKGIIKIEI